MIVLRMRIRDTKATKGGCEPEPPCDWTEWEKKFAWEGGYKSDICGAMRWFQSSLMEVRSVLALVVVPFVVLSVPVATTTVMFHLVDL
ncbi:hypothetical protein U1Q18_047578 [Sarracenia purpurea var. burkii]